jgi:hypothetical protein
MAFDLQDLLTRGIDAYAETQQVRYGANDPTPNSRGATQTTAPTGEPAFSNAVDGPGSNTNMLLLLGAAVLVYLLLQKS